MMVMARREGRDVSKVLGQIRRLHKLAWQKGRPDLEEEEATLSFEKEKKGEMTPSQRESYQEVKAKFRSKLQAHCIKEGINLASQTLENRNLIIGIIDSILKDHLREIPGRGSRGVFILRPLYRPGCRLSPGDEAQRPGTRPRGRAGGRDSIRGLQAPE